MSNKLEDCILNDYYGGLLNKHQSEVLRMYYDCDMTLSEISEESGITRQGIREIIARSTKKLQNFEDKLGLIKKVNEIAAELKRIISDTPDGATKKELEGLLHRIKEL